jgi:hypothetical protein
MALTEEKNLSQVTVLADIGTVNVQWTNKILKDGVVVAEQFERKAYDESMAAEFVDEVDGAQHYIAILGWLV